MLYTVSQLIVLTGPRCYSQYFGLNNPTVPEAAHPERPNTEDSLFLPATRCVHRQNMLFWDPHGRFLLACILNNQLLSGLPVAACGATEMCPGNLGGLTLGGEGAVWLLRLSIRRLVGMLGAQSGDSTRAIPLTVMWLSRQPRPTPFFTHHPSRSPCTISTHYFLHNSSNRVSDHLKQRWLLYPSASK